VHTAFSIEQMSIGALLFDLDGTLVHTIPHYKTAYLRSLRDIGSSISSEEFDTIYYDARPLSHVLEERGTGHRIDEVRKQRDALYEQALREEVEWYPDALDFLKSLDPALPRAIVTGSWRSYVDAIEHRLPLSQYFPIIITAEDFMPDSKPHPKGLLVAAERLGIQPEHCAYIGDQIFDIEAAKAAGMTDVLIPREHTPQRAPEMATHVIESLMELNSLL